MNKGKALIGVLAGVAAGAVLGVLLAPNKGSDTRKKISRRGEDLANALSDKVDERFDELIAAVKGKSKKSSATNDSTVNKSEVVM